MCIIAFLIYIITQVQKVPAFYRYFPAGVNDVNSAVFRGFAALNEGSAKSSRKTEIHKKRGLMKISRKNKTLRRKEIVYSAEEWEQIEKQAAECHLKTSTCKAYQKSA